MMSEQTYRLVYYSRSRIPGDAEAVAAEIPKILAASRTNNKAAGVTGALLFSLGSFGQVLEGQRGAVEATFERIQRDPRHCDVSLLSFDAVSSFAFTNWSMAFVGSEQLERARYGEIAAQSGFDPARISADELFKTLQRLTIQEGADNTAG